MTVPATVAAAGITASVGATSWSTGPASASNGAVPSNALRRSLFVPHDHDDRLSVMLSVGVIQDVQVRPTVDVIEKVACVWLGDAVVVGVLPAADIDTVGEGPTPEEALCVAVAADAPNTTRRMVRLL